MSEDELKGVIAKYLKIRCKNHQEVIRATKIPSSTYYRKIAKPLTMSVADLKLILDYLKVPAEERTI